MKKLDPNNEVDATVLSLVEKGLVDYGYNEEGELIIFLTETGQSLAEEILEGSDFRQ